MKQYAQTADGNDRIDKLIKENIDLIDRLTAAEMSVKDYRAKNTMLREALDAITHPIKRTTHLDVIIAELQNIAKIALNKTGGEK